MKLSLNFLYQKLGQITAREYLLAAVFIFCIPAFVVNIKDFQDWGDDYAQYLSQAEALLAGKTQVENGYIYQEFAKGMCPKAYPMGFPAFLTVPLAIDGYNVPLILFCIALMAMLWFVAIIKLFDNKVSFISLAAILLFTFYNGEFLILKGEILSEIPFAATSFFAIYFLEKIIRGSWQKSNILWACYFTIFMIFTRSIGWVLVPSIIVFAIRIRPSKISWAKVTAIVLVLILLYLIISKFILQIPSEGGYSDQLFFITAETLWRNITLYPQLLGVAFTGHEDLVIKNIYIFPLIIFTSIIIKWIKQPSLFDVYFIAYLMLIMIYPHITTRFLIPLFPFILFYLFWIFEFVIERFKKQKLILGIVITYIVIFFTFRTITQFPKAVTASMIADSPFSETSQEMFKYIRDNTPQNSGILFIKPRLLSWETKRKTLIPDGGSTVEENMDLMNKNGVNYALLFKKGFSHQEGIERTILNNPSFILIKENDDFQLYQNK